MKEQFNFMIIFFLAGFLVAIIFVSYSYIYEKNKFLEEASKSLIDINEEKAIRINHYLYDMKNNIEFLQESEEVKNLLEQDLSFDKSTIIADVNQRARIITKEIENYIRAHPEMTFKDLKESEEFRGIAVQPVGKEGYSVVFDCDSMVNAFHKEIEIEGFSYYDKKDEFPAWWEITKKTVGCHNDSSGFYEWRYPEEVLRDNYKSSRIIPVRTSDGVGLAVSVIAYVDDYKVIKNVSVEDDGFLRGFKEGSDYYNLALISKDGYVGYVVDESGVLGTNLEWEVGLNRGMSKIYFQGKESQKVSFYGPFIGDYGDIYPRFSIIAPVYTLSGHKNLRAGNEDNLLGYVVLVRQMRDIFEITQREDGIGKTEESYLVDYERLLISPLRVADYDMMVQSVNTENSARCFSDPSGTQHIGHDAVDVLVNYMGGVTVATHSVILGPSWCLLTEISKEEVIDIPVGEIAWKNLYFSILGVFILTLAGFFVGRSFDKRRGAR